MKFKNPLDYVKNIINKFKELVNYPYKRKLYTGILIVPLYLAMPLTLICLWFAYVAIPNETARQAVTDTIKEFKCHPSGFKHGPFCRVKFDNQLLRFEFGDKQIILENGKKAYVGDLLKTAYDNNKCIYVEFSGGLIHKFEYCNGEVLYQLKDISTFYHTRKVALSLGIFFLVLSIVLIFLINKEYKKEINQNFSIKDKKWEK